jgi:D-glycero-D-manno-heptose 1,7-bisphosphate phosphatase
MPTIFLDRDGVINRKIEGGYVTSWDEFEWLPGSLEAMVLLTAKGWDIFIVTNQACVGKGVIGQDELDQIHDALVNELTRHGAIVKGIYFCPHRSDECCICRKPEPGMLLKAATDHSLTLASCYFVGDSITDMQASSAAGTYGIFIGENEKQDRGTTVPYESYRVRNLLEAVHHAIERENQHG